MPRHFSRSALIVFLLAALCWAAPAPIPTPEQFAGFRMGTERKLLRYDKVAEYFRIVDAASDRVQVESMGKSTSGNDILVAIVSSPETLRNLAQHKEMQRRMAYPHTLDEQQAKPLLATQKAVLLVTTTIHATEVAASQMATEALHRLATEDSPEVQRILDNVILLFVPSINPDGNIIVTDHYNKNLGTPYENTALTELYHKYTGHDNNRDAFMNTQLESQALNRLTYKEWFPQVYLDMHQMGSMGARLWVPPFANPINPNIDPVIWELNGMLGYAMGLGVHSKGYTGVINGEQFTSWWQGGFVMQAWWHNMVGLLTEMASSRMATRLEQTMARPGQAPAPPVDNAAMARLDPSRPLPPPRDITSRHTYPRPWMGGTWTLRNIIDYEEAALYALLDAVAANRALLTRNFYEMNRRQIELGKTQAPYAWVIPANQHDQPVAAHMAKLLDEGGGEVFVAKDSFQADGRTFPQGSYVVPMAQPFRPFLKDLLEKQEYPVQRATPNGPVERPYDVTGWTLPYQMGVETVPVQAKFEAKLERASSYPIPEGKWEPAASKRTAGYVLSHANNNAAIAVNRLLKQNYEVSWDATGGIFVEARAASLLRRWAKELGVQGKAVTARPTGLRRLQAPRIAIYQPWSPSMDEGWTRWMLEQYEFPYTPVRDADVKAGNLRGRFDVVLLADIAKTALLRGLEGDWIRPEHRGGLGTDGVAALKRFVQEGGTLVTLGNSSLLPVEEFPLPVKNALRGLRPDQFSCPGSLLRVFMDPSHPVAYGMKEEATAVFYNDVAFELVPAMGGTQVRVVARYPSTQLLQSGWIGGEEHLHDRIAAAEVSFGKGRVVLLGFSVQMRAQPHGTFKLLFNALHYGGAAPEDARVAQAR